MELKRSRHTVFYDGHRFGGGAKGNWDFWISDLVKNPDGADI